MLTSTTALARSHSARQLQPQPAGVRDVDKYNNTRQLRQCLPNATVLGKNHSTRQLRHHLPTATPVVHHEVQKTRSFPENNQLYRRQHSSRAIDAIFLSYILCNVNLATTYLANMLSPCYRPTYANAALTVIFN
jgi:hypothetical protein